MRTLTNIPEKNSKNRQGSSFQDKYSDIGLQLNDQLPRYRGIVGSHHDGMEYMSPNHDPGYHQIAPQASSASIQMTPNQQLEMHKGTGGADIEHFGSQITATSPKLTSAKPGIQMKSVVELPVSPGSSIEIANAMMESQPPPIQREVGAEQPENEESAGTTIAETENPPAPQTQVCDRTLPETEVQQREDILQDLTREFQIDQSVRNVLISSMCDFSLNQLQQMQQAGLRIWSRGSLPPLFASDDIEIDTSQGGHAAYVRGIRTIFLTERVNSGFLTHEMAHAWDHIRNLPTRNRVRLETLSRRRRLQLAQDPGRYLTETSREQQLSGEGPAASRRFTFEQMYQNYVARVPRRELAFSRASRAGYSRVSAQEFYAEGYAVFHSNSEYEQAKMYRYARELYIYLYDEANRDNMPVPNLANVRAEARRLPPPR